MNIKARIIALMTAVLILAGSLGTAALAEGGQLTVDERALQLYEESVKEKYEAFYKDAYHSFLMSDGIFLGAQIVRDIQTDGASGQLAEWAAERAGVRLSKEQWALYQAAQMAMQEEGFSGAARSLAEYDSLKGLKEYATDVVGMAATALDLQKFPEAALETISDWLGVAAGLLDGTAYGLGKYQDMLTLARSYENHVLFLNSVIEHAGDETLKEAAEFLLEASDRTLAMQQETNGIMALLGEDGLYRLFIETALTP